MKCESCGSTNMKQEDKKTWVCQDCWHVQRTLSKRSYSYPLDPYPVGDKTRRKRY